MKKYLAMILATMMVLSLAACGSKANTATINNIKFELPKGYSVEQASEVFGEENEYQCKDTDGQPLFAIAYVETEWSQFGFNEFEQYYESFFNGLDCELIDFANSKGAKFSAGDQGINGYESLVYAITNKKTTATVYVVAYQEKDADVVNAFLNAVK